MKSWKVLKETDVSPSKWFPVKQHQVELPNGNIVEDYFITTLDNVGMILNNIHATASLAFTKPMEELNEKARF